MAFFPPRPQARQTNRGPRRATMPACRPLHGSKSTNAGQQFCQAGHRRRANSLSQALWAIACSTRWACWPIDRPQTRCFFWLLFFSAEKKSDEPRPAGRGTVPAPAGAKPPRPRRAALLRRAGAKPRPQAHSRTAGAKPRRRRKPRAAGAKPRRRRKPRAAGAKPRRRRKPRAAGAPYHTCMPVSISRTLKNVAYRLFSIMASMCRWPKYQLR